MKWVRDRWRRNRGPQTALIFVSAGIGRGCCTAPHQERYSDEADIQSIIDAVAKIRENVEELKE